MFIQTSKQFVFQDEFFTLVSAEDSGVAGRTIRFTTPAYERDRVLSISGARAALYVPGAPEGERYAMGEFPAEGNQVVWLRHWLQEARDKKKLLPLVYEQPWILDYVLACTSYSGFLVARANTSRVDPLRTIFYGNPGLLLRVSE
jgi:hypothetical protein